MFYLRSIHGFYAAALLELGGLLAGGGEGGAGGRGREAGDLWSLPLLPGGDSLRGISLLDKQKQ